MLLPSPGGAGGNGKVFCAAGRSIGGGAGHACGDGCGYSRRTRTERKTEKMIDRNQVKAELTMRIRFAAGGTTPVSATLLESALELLEEDEKKISNRIGRWKEVHGYVTPGGDPVFGCANCGGSEHVYGVEHPRKKLICDNCGCINLYPWEKSYDETSSLAQN